MPKKTVECALAWLLAMALTVLILVQVGMYRGSIKPTDTWLGAEYAGEDEMVAAASGAAVGIVEYELVDFSRLELAEILVNGQVAAVFDEPVARVRVCDGDVLALNTMAYGSPVRVRLQKTSSGIDGAFLLCDVQACGEVLELGRVVFRQISLT